jgi:hypothetical protein
LPSFSAPKATEVATSIGRDWNCMEVAGTWNHGFFWWNHDQDHKLGWNHGCLTWTEDDFCSFYIGDSWVWPMVPGCPRYPQPHDGCRISGADHHWHWSWGFAISLSTQDPFAHFLMSLQVPKSK